MAMSTVLRPDGGLGHSGPGRRRRRGARSARILSVGVLSVWFVLPLLPLLLWAPADRWASGDALPSRVGLANLWAAVGTGALPAFARSVLLAAAVAVIATPLGALAARALGARHTPGRTALAVLLFAPVALPPFAVVVGLNVLLLRLHLAGPAGVLLVLVVYALPYTTFVIRSAYTGYDRGFEEEARLLGARPRQVVTHVQVPLLLPAITRAAFLAFLVGWSDYLVTLLVAGGQFVTVPLLVASSATNVGDTGVTAVLSLASIVPPLVLLMLLTRRGRRSRSLG